MSYTIYDATTKDFVATSYETLSEAMAAAEGYSAFWHRETHVIDAHVVAKFNDKGDNISVIGGGGV